MTLGGSPKLLENSSMIISLRNEHIYITPFSRMRVDLAFHTYSASVITSHIVGLSKTVADALLLTHNEAVTETAKFAHMFDCFFDCLNILNFREGTLSRKSFQLPYRSKDDFRIEVCYCNSNHCEVFPYMQWMKTDFLPYVDKVGKMNEDSEDKSCEVAEDQTAKERKKRGVSS